MKSIIKFATVALACITTSINALELTSEDVNEGHHMAKTFEFQGWGCSGSNLSPELTWSDAPSGTKSFAVTMYDPDAPTESGFWHWLVTDIPASVNSLARGADVKKLGAKVFRNDYGNFEFGGACPPVDHGMHRYQITVWALPMSSLELGKNTSAAVVGFNLNGAALAKKTLTTTYSR